MAQKPPTQQPTYVVEHLDPELGPWSALEYGCIARETYSAGATFLLTSVPESLQMPADLTSLEGLKVERRSVEDIFADRKSKICLLDPAAKEELQPSDGDLFEVFLFGGILGDDPPRGKIVTAADRTSELRHKGYATRRLGPKQMTTDTAVRVTRLVAQKSIPMDKIPYVDYPELRLGEHETTEMPFRYVKDEQEKPIMPDGMIDLIKKDADKSFDDIL